MPLRHTSRKEREGRSGLRYAKRTVSSLQRKPLGFVVVGAFLFFGAMMAGLSATTLLHPGTILDRAWTLNPTAYRQLSPLGSKLGILFLILSAALAVSGIGWFRRRLWGWRLAVAIIATQVLGDIIWRPAPRPCTRRSRSPHQPRQRRLAARGDRSHHRRSIIDIPFVAPDQSGIFGHR